MNYFFDQHFHLMDISHPNLLSFFNSIESGVTELFTSGALLPSYIITPKSRRSHTLLRRITNTLTTFEQSIGQTLIMMEDDLLGHFASHESETPHRPYIREGKFHFRNRVYDHIALAPMLMDFSAPEGINDALYYPLAERERIFTYIEDTLQGFAHYHERRPDGLFSFFPFVGITTASHSLSTIEHILDSYVVTAERPAKKERQFYGIKVYPPLGFDPWPEEAVEREKVEAIYDFCTTNQIPLMTHCDDQGFRGMPAKEAWRVSEPNAWRPVLEAYPALQVDFAHFGKQYTPLQKNPLTVLSGLAHKVPDSSWFYQIIELMQEYPNVYADVSFSGSHEEFYLELATYLASLATDEQEQLKSRILFGTDFAVNLMKVESYSAYYRIFENSPFNDEEIHSFVQTNCLRYMGWE